MQILDPKRKIIVLKHPYYEDYVVLPTRSNIRVDNKSVAQEARSRPQSDEASLSRWSPSSWVNTLLEKHAWFSAGLVWLPGASMSADVGVFDDSPTNDSAARPTLSLFEQWEEGAHVTRIANARDYSFPSSLVIPHTWNSASRALSLSDALNHVSLHDEKDEWGPATFTQPVPGVKYPNQPRSDPSSDLSDPLTYWWGATLCPPELNDVSLAETVAIMMRYAALREVNLNTEVQKPSLAAVLEFKGATMGSEYESDREWHLRNMHYGEGWACDSTQSHSKRAKPTYTDPEDDRMTDSSLPIGSKSKTYDPEKDGNFWRQCDRGQSWSYSSSSSGQWRPRLWHERAISSAAGDTSDASNAVHHLRSIREDDSDAVRASSEWKNQWW